MSPDAWTLSTHQFRLLWEEIDAGDYPIEFAYTGADDIDRASDAPERRSIRFADLTVPQQAAMTGLCRPSITIALTGIDAARPFSDTGHHLRLISATDDSENVYVARQKLGSSTSIGGTVAITKHSFALWTRDLVGMIPDASGQGALAADTAVRFQAMPGVDEHPIRAVVAPASPTAATAFTHPTPGVCGSIRVSIGSIVAGGRPTALEVRYRDIADDGRYLLIVDDPGAALPVDATAFAKTLNRVVNTIRARHEAKTSAVR